MEGARARAPSGDGSRAAGRAARRASALTSAEEPARPEEASGPEKPAAPGEPTGPGALYLDTSAVLRAVLESGTTPELERDIREAAVLITSRVSRVGTARALLRLRALGLTSEEGLADAAREIEALWARCELWELTPTVCDLASEVSPTKPLRTLDVLHLATYLLARRRIEGLELRTADTRLAEAAGTA